LRGAVRHENPVSAGGRQEDGAPRPDAQHKTTVPLSVMHREPKKPTSIVASSEGASSTVQMLRKLELTPSGASKPADPPKLFSLRRSLPVNSGPVLARTVEAK